MTDLFGGFPETTPLSDADVQFLDTTLRDGEQAPGVSLSPDQKVAVARTLDRAGVSTIEAGSACTGAGERETISRVTQENLDARASSFCRGIRRDIDLAIDCGVDGVNLVVPASERHIEGKVGTTREEVVGTTADLVEYAREHGLWVEVLGEDGSRADPAFLTELMGAAIDAGADRICYCDTVGSATPAHTGQVVADLADLGPTSAHTHDDLGMAVTNALAAVAAGADLVHATVNGIGERAGNVALEEVAIALAEGYGVETLDTTVLYDLARTVADATGIALAPNKAVVGENAFTHESGIHTDGQLKDEAMYEPYPPETVGRERRLELGKHAGRAGVAAALSEHGVDASDDDLAAITDRVTDLGDQGRRVTDADVLALAEEVQGREREPRVELLDLTAAGGSGAPAASVRLRVDSEVLRATREAGDAGDAERGAADGGVVGERATDAGRERTDPPDYDERVASGTGSGPVDAAVTAVRSALGPAVDARLDSYHVDAITGGTDALVTVEIEMTQDGQSVAVTASDVDITRASVEAMVEAFDRLLAA